MCNTFLYLFLYIIFLVLALFFRHNKYRNNRSIEKQGILGKSKFNVGFLLIQMVVFIVVIIIIIIILLLLFDAKGTFHKMFSCQNKIENNKNMF